MCDPPYGGLTVAWLGIGGGLVVLAGDIVADVALFFHAREVEVFARREHVAVDRGVFERAPHVRFEELEDERVVVHA